MKNYSNKSIANNVNVTYNNEKENKKTFLTSTKSKGIFLITFFLIFCIITSNMHKVMNTKVTPVHYTRILI